MKKQFLSFALVISILTFFASCKQKSPIWDRTPSDTTFSTGFPLTEFHKLGEANDTVAQKAIVNKYRRQLTKNIMSHYPCVRDEENVRLVFGSGKVKDLLSGDGKTYSGKFKNELIVIVNDSCVRDTVFLACGNGMLSPINFKSYSDWGSVEKCKFEIEKGQSLAYYLPKIESWGIKANELGIPIADADGKVVNHKVYMNQLGKWWSSYLFPGDIIDLCDGTVKNKAGQVVDFERRILETKKLKNKLLKQKSL